MASVDSTGRSPAQRRPRWRRHVTRRRVVVAVAVMVVTIGAYGVWLASRVGGVFHENPISIIHDVIARGSNSDLAAAAQQDHRITIALYGYGGGGHDGAYLSDSILVVSIQPHHGAAAQVAEISIPRDWFVPIDLGNGHSYHGRINEAYSDGVTDAYPQRDARYTGDLGGGALADATLQRLLGIHIDRFVGVDFHAFQYAVDAVGGVDVTVQHTFTDTQYPRGECNPNGGGDCAYTTIHFNAGPQHMDGATALVFARSRHSLDPGEGTDFARSRRQQLVLQALRDRVLSIGGIASLPAVLNALGDHVRTDMSLADAQELYALVRDVAPASVEHVSINDRNFLYECGYPFSCSAAYLLAHDSSFRSIAHYVVNIFPTAAATAQRAPVVVLDGSGQGGAAAARWASLLQMMGMQALYGGSAPTTPTTAVRAADVGSPTASWLGSFFGAGVSLDAVEAARPRPGAVVTLVIGADEERAFNGAGFSSSPGGGAALATPAPRIATHTPVPTASPAPTAPPTMVTTTSTSTSTPASTTTATTSATVTTTSTTRHT